MSKKAVETPESADPVDRLEREFEEMEETGGRKYALRLVAILVLVAAAVAAFSLRSGGKRESSAVTFGPTSSTLIETYEPARGKLAAAPTRFRWEPIAGRKGYVFLLSMQGATMPIVSRSTRETGVELTPEEIASLPKSGMYAWEVRAMNHKGELIAVGRAQFSL